MHCRGAVEQEWYSVTNCIWAFELFQGEEINGLRVNSAYLRYRARRTARAPTVGVGGTVDVGGCS